MRKKPHPLPSVSATGLRRLLLLSTALIFCALSARAQRQDSTKLAPEAGGKLYVGLGLSSVSYMLSFSHPLGGSIEPVVFPHIGYRLTPRLSIQVGVGYGRDKFETGGSYFESKEDEESGIVTHDIATNTTKGWAVPLTLRFTPFNPNRCLQLYATASLVPTYGSTRHTFERRRAGASSDYSEAGNSGFNTFFTAGLLLKYRINSRLDAYMEGNLLYRHLGKQSDYADSRPRSLGLGLNYRL